MGGGSINVPVYLLVAMTFVIVTLTLSIVGAIMKGRVVPSRYYDEALERVKEERSAKEAALKLVEESLAMNKRLVMRDDIMAQFVEALRRDARWITRQPDLGPSSTEGIG